MFLCICLHLYALNVDENNISKFVTFLPMSSWYKFNFLKCILHTQILEARTFCFNFTGLTMIWLLSPDPEVVICILYCIWIFPREFVRMVLADDVVEKLCSICTRLGFRQTSDVTFNHHMFKFLVYINIWPKYI